MLEIVRGDAVVELFKRDDISLNIEFAADTTYVMFGRHNSVASHLKESQTPFLYTAFVPVHTCVHHMHVKSFPVQLKNFFRMCVTTSATVPNIKQSLGLFRPLLNWSHTYRFVHVKYVGFPCMLVFQGLLSNGMYLYSIFNL